MNYLSGYENWWELSDGSLPAGPSWGWAPSLPPPFFLPSALGGRGLGEGRSCLRVRRGRVGPVPLGGAPG